MLKHEQKEINDDQRVVIVTLKARQARPESRENSYVVLLHIEEQGQIKKLLVTLQVNSSLKVDLHFAVVEGPKLLS